MDNKNTNLRPPIVVILGHVDHGKTSLLDYIRKSNVAGREAGGITQSIGASQVVTENGQKLTFIDTPGHAAFSEMRSRGAKLADIAILVVASNEGVKPQTKEALEYVLAAKTPFLVAATKVDLQQTSIEIVISSLGKEGVFFEGKGGEVPLISVSVKTGQGVKELLETISLLSELHEIKGEREEPLDGTVIETRKDKAGPLVSAVIRNGTLSIGDHLITETSEGKVRGLIDQTGKGIKSVYPGDPVQILGFSELPPVGSNIWKREDKGEILPQRRETNKVLTAPVGQAIPILIKSGSAGSLEALLENISKEVFLIGSGVGDLNESDVFLAKSANAPIFVFEAKVPSGVARLAETESVRIESFNIIYRLFERVEELLKMGIVEVLGEAIITAEFPYEGKRVAGCKILKGVIRKAETLTLKREEKELGEVKIISLKKGKQDVLEVKQGEECGIFFAPQLDFKLSDMLLSLRKQ